MLNNENTWKLEEAKEAGNDLNPVGGGRIVGLGRSSGSSLLWAAFSNRVDLIDSLLQQPNVDVNAKDMRGNTALHHACCLPAGNAIMPKLLATPGILLNEENRKGMTPIVMAAAYKRIEAVQMLAAVDKVDLDVRDRQTGASLEDIAWNRPNMLQVLKEARQRRDSTSHAIFLCSWDLEIWHRVATPKCCI